MMLQHQQQQLLQRSVVVPRQVLLKMPPKKIQQTLESTAREFGHNHSNLMGDEDIDSIIRVQLVQVHTGSAWNDDYYHQNVRMRKSGDRTLTSEQLKRLNIPIPGLSSRNEQRGEKREQREKERMELLVNSLGAATRVSSARAPRPLLQVPVAEDATHRRCLSQTSDDGGPVLLTDSYSLRLTAESVSLLLCDLKDLVLVSQSTEMNAFIDTLDDQKVEIVESIFELLRIHQSPSVTDEGLWNEETIREDDFFVSMLLNPKGRLAVTRAIPLFTQTQTSWVVRVVLRNLSLLASILTNNRNPAPWFPFIEVLRTCICRLPLDTICSLVCEACSAIAMSSRSHALLILACPVTAALLLAHASAAKAVAQESLGLAQGAIDDALREGWTRTQTNLYELVANAMRQGIVADSALTLAAICTPANQNLNQNLTQNLNVQPSAVL
eukprot:c10927_g4_i1.p1 GENE.c10927_g4_i1~~c10927_g4_i1.p1  ORF type:complete len:484 (-),score=147.49 c10927_g4_i1:192-1511(-)